MFERHRQKAVVLFAAADVVLTVLAFEAAYQTRLRMPLPLEFFLPTPTKLLLLAAAAGLWAGVGRWIGVYERMYGNDTRAWIYDTFRQVLFGTLGLVAVQYLLDPQLAVSRAFIALFAFYNLLLLLVYRGAANRLRGWIRMRFGAESFFVVVGSGERAAAMARELEGARDYGVRLVALADPDDGAERSVQLDASYPVKKLSELPGMLRDNVIDEIIFAVDAGKLAELEEIFLLCDEQGVRTRVVMDFFPHVNSKVDFERFNNVPLLTFSATPRDELRLFVKRVFDVGLSAAALTLLFVPMLLLSVLVKATSKGPAIFRQVRCGLNGRRFEFYKFRSMVENAEELRSQVEHLNEKDGPVFKVSSDPRQTRLGAYLRRFSIDEWPQFWNVFRGDMSFVGPRPAVPSEVDQYEAWQRRRLRMRPGLTCSWAVRGRDALDFETWMKLDLEYIDNWSLGLDLKILLRSIPRVLAGRGAS